MIFPTFAAKTTFISVNVKHRLRHAKIYYTGIQHLVLLSLNAATPETHYTVIVSLDGFRWDYPDMYKTPNLNRMAADGVKAVMLPSYPASTFPNHYTLATGLVPDHHGIINNTFGM